MKIISIKCQACGQLRTRITFVDDTRCPSDTCCDCCKKHDSQTPECRMDMLEFERYIEGKQLNKNDIKGMQLERAISNALKALQIPHKHNPFNNTYPCYQNKCPDIIIEKLDTVIECKNLSKKQVDHLTTKWLDKHIIDRDYNKGYKHKIALFSFKPRLPLFRYLHNHGWKAYCLGTQILTSREEQKASGKLVSYVHWLKKEYSCQVVSQSGSQLELVK